MNEIAHINGMERPLYCIYVMQSTSNEMDYSVSWKELKHVARKIARWYGLECLSSLMGGPTL